MQSIAAKVGWVLAGLLGLTLAASWAGVITAGPLDPPGSPASTMKSLDDIPSSWSRLLSSSGGCNSERFQCVLLGDAGVLDKETGLVWMRTPINNTMDWGTAFVDCRDRNVGDRLGWRVPTAAELQSLVDLSSVDGLPADDPFIYSGPNVTFWSASRDTASPTTRAIRVSIDDGSAIDEPNSNQHRVWCVRGPSGGEAQ